MVHGRSALVSFFMASSRRAGSTNPNLAGRCVLRCVVAEDVKKRVGHVRLEAESFGLSDFFEQVDHLLPAVHAAPADFAFGSEAFAE